MSSYLNKLGGKFNDRLSANLPYTFKLVNLDQQNIRDRDQRGSEEKVPVAEKELLPEQSLSPISMSSKLEPASSF